MLTFQQQQYHHNQYSYNDSGDNDDVDVGRDCRRSYNTQY